MGGRKERSVLAYSVKVQAIMVGVSWRQKCEAADDTVSPGQDAEMDISSQLLSLLFTGKFSFECPSLFSQMRGKRPLASLY